MRILLVEDDESMAATLTTGLRAEGYAVDVSHDGEDGLWRALEEDYDLVVLDIMLPGRNGYAVVSALRSAGRPLSHDEVAERVGGSVQEARVALQRLTHERRARRTLDGRASKYVAA